MSDEQEDHGSGGVQDFLGWLDDIVSDGWEDADETPGADDLQGLGDDAPQRDLPSPLDDELDVEAKVGLEDLADRDGAPVDLDASDDGGGADAGHDVPTITLGDDPGTGDDAAGPDGVLDGTTTLGALRAFAIDAGADGSVDVDAAFDRLGLDDGFLGVAGRTAALVLQELGVDAYVSHGSVEELADRIGRGQDVVLESTDGERARVVDIDFRAGALLVDHAGTSHQVDLAAFARSWSTAANEMVVSEAAGQAATSVLVPVRIDVGGISG